MEYPRTIQKGNTCWFHASLNGFLLSKYGRRYLHRLVGESGPVAPKHSCPAKNVTLSRALPYIRLYLKEGVKNNNTNLKVFAPNKTKNSLGYFTNVIHVFPSVKYTKLQYFPRKTVGSNLFTRLSGFVLSHCYIQLQFTDGTSHSVTGFINSKGKYLVYDSEGYYKQLSARWDTAQGTEEIKEFYDEDVKVSGVLVYVPYSRPVPVANNRTVAKNIRAGKLNSNLSVRNTNAFKIQMAKYNRIAALLKNNKYNYSALTVLGEPFSLDVRNANSFNLKEAKKNLSKRK